LCFNGIVYARAVEGQDLRFQVAGFLWKRSLVMRDLETGTLWSHLLGRGMEGHHEGMPLEMLPATMTTWGDWRESYPSTTVLAMERTAERYRKHAWKRARSFVFGVPHPEDSRETVAVSLELLQKEGVVTLETQGGRRIVVTHDGRGGSIQAFVAEREGEDLELREADRSGHMIDPRSGDRWDRRTGKLLRDEAVQLQKVAGTISFRAAWEAFYPEGHLEDLVSP
ncbi:MAG: DUF3179 domain-containing (seleno)protein, partial [Verrucomicrobiota bacterium]